MRPKQLVRSAVVALLSLSLLALTGPAQADTRIHVENPRFGKPSVEQEGQNWRNVGIGDAAMPGWSVTHGNVDIYGRGFAKAPTGTQALSLNGGGPGTISQTLETTPGARVTITWLHSPDTWGGCNSGTGQRYIAGVTGQDTPARVEFDPGYPTTGGNWKRARLSFVATEDLTTLEFASTNNGGACGPLITDVVARDNA